MSCVPRRTIFCALLTVLAYVAGFFSMWIKVDPFAGGGAALPLVSAGSGLAFAVAAHTMAGPLPPRGFALIGVGFTLEGPDNGSSTGARNGGEQGTTRGTATLIGSPGEVRERMQALFAKIERPVLRDLEVHWNDEVEMWNMGVRMPNH